MRSALGCINSGLSQRDRLPVISLKEAGMDQPEGSKHQWTLLSATSKATQVVWFHLKKIQTEFSSDQVTFPPMDAYPKQRLKAAGGKRS